MDSFETLATEKLRQRELSGNIAAMIGVYMFNFEVGPPGSLAVYFLIKNRRPLKTAPRTTNAPVFGSGTET